MPFARSFYFFLLLLYTRSLSTLSLPSFNVLLIAPLSRRMCNGISVWWNLIGGRWIFFPSTMKTHQYCFLLRFTAIADRTSWVSVFLVVQVRTHQDIVLCVGRKQKAVQGHHTSLENDKLVVSAAGKKKTFFRLFAVACFWSRRPTVWQLQFRLITHNPKNHSPHLSRQSW